MSYKDTLYFQFDKNIPREKQVEWLESKGYKSKF